MTIEERAAKLVGDMPWVTEHLTPEQLVDLPKQIATCIEMAVQEKQAQLDDCHAFLRIQTMGLFVDNRAVAAELLRKHSQ